MTDGVNFSEQFPEPEKKGNHNRIILIVAGCALVSMCMCVVGFAIFGFVLSANEGAVFSNQALDTIDIVVETPAEVSRDKSFRMVMDICIDSGANCSTQGIETLITE